MITQTEHNEDRPVDRWLSSGKTIKELEYMVSTFDTLVGLSPHRVGEVFYYRYRLQEDGSFAFSIPVLKIGLNSYRVGNNLEDIKAYAILHNIEIRED